MCGTQLQPGMTPAEPTSWDLPRQPIAARLARRRLASELPDLPGDVVEVAQVLTSELVTNAVQHGRGPIRMSVACDGSSLTVRVADDGAEAPVVRDRDLDASRGRGMQLIEALATQWGTEPVGGGAGKAVWFTLHT